MKYKTNTSISTNVAIVVLIIIVLVVVGGAISYQDLMTPNQSTSTIITKTQTTSGSGRTTVTTTSYQCNTSLAANSTNTACVTGLQPPAGGDSNDTTTNSTYSYNLPTYSIGCNESQDQNLGYYPWNFNASIRDNGNGTMGEDPVYHDIPSVIFPSGSTLETICSLYLYSPNNKSALERIQLDYLPSITAYPNGGSYYTVSSFTGQVYYLAPNSTVLRGPVLTLQSNCGPNNAVSCGDPTFNATIPLPGNNYSAWWVTYYLSANEKCCTN